MYKLKYISLVRDESEGKHARLRTGDDIRGKR